MVSSLKVFTTSSEIAIFLVEQAMNQCPRNQDDKIDLANWGHCSLAYQKIGPNEFLELKSFFWLAMKTPEIPEFNKSRKWGIQEV